MLPGTIAAVVGLFAAFPLGAERFVKSGAATLHAVVEGNGPTIVFLPSLGRGAEDFEDLAARLVAGGYRTVRPDPRQIGRSTGPITGLSLHDMAADVAAVIREVGGAPVILLGHAFGSRLARMTAADHPTLVRQLVLLGAGGARGGTSQAVLDGITRCFDTTLSRDEHLAAVGRMFFAPGHDPSAWEHGWHRPVMEAQRAATAATKQAAWWSGGTAPILLLQPERDAISEPEVAHALRDEFPGRVTLIEIPNAGHALMPEQPELVAKAILDYLNARHPRP
jgi:pimeloyl-ACP methyl ester carboxylesterase